MALQGGVRRRRIFACGILLLACTYVFYMTLPRILVVEESNSLQQARDSIVSGGNGKCGVDLRWTRSNYFLPASSPAQALGYRRVSTAAASLSLTSGRADGDTGCSAACALLKGRGCTAYHSQEPIPSGALPRGNKSCILDCNHVGTCVATAGFCQCPMGEWVGDWQPAEPARGRCSRTSLPLNQQILHLDRCCLPAPPPQTSRLDRRWLPHPPAPPLHQQAA